MISLVQLLAEKISEIPNEESLKILEQAIARRRQELEFSPLGALGRLGTGILDAEKLLYKDIRKQLVQATDALKVNLRYAKNLLGPTLGIPYAEYLSLIREGYYDSRPLEAYAERVVICVGLQKAMRLKSFLAEAITKIMDDRAELGLPHVLVHALHAETTKADLALELTSQLRSASVPLSYRTVFSERRSEVMNEVDQLVALWTTRLADLRLQYNEITLSTKGPADTLSGVMSLTEDSISHGVPGTSRTTLEVEMPRISATAFRTTAISICTRGSSLYSNPNRKRTISVVSNCETSDCDTDSGSVAKRAKPTVSTAPSELTRGHLPGLGDWVEHIDTGVTNLTVSMPPVTGTGVESKRENMSGGANH